MCRLISIFTLLFLTLLLATFQCFADSNPQPDIADLGRLALRQFKDKDGLPQNTIRAMSFDQKNYLWVGTQDGAAYYNGRKWIVVNMPNRNISNHIQALLVSSDGSIWFGSAGGGLSRLKNGEWTTYDMSSGLPNNSVTCLLETSSLSGGHALWIGTRGGLARMEDGKVTAFDTRSVLSDKWINCLLETSSLSGTRTLWVGTNGNGLTQLDDGKLTTFDTSSGLPDNRVNCLLETASKDGRRILWIGTYGGLTQLDDGKWITLDTKTGLPDNIVYSLLETTSKDSRRIFWIGTFGGLVRMEEDRLTTYDTRSGLPNYGIFTLLEAPSKDGIRELWLGTLGGGLVRMELGKWITFDTGSGLPDNRVYNLLETISQDGDSSLWISSVGGGLARLEKGKWTTFDAKSGLPDNAVWRLLETRLQDGTPVIWAGTRNGLARLEKGKWTTLDTRSGLPDNWITNLLETTSQSGKSILWVGTRNGLARLEDGKWTTYDTKSGLPNNEIWSLLETRLENGIDTLWVGTAGGLARLEEGKWTTYDSKFGLSNSWICSLLETRSQNGTRTLWVGTKGGGVSRLNLSSGSINWTTLSDTTRPALPNNTVYQIREDAKKRIYLFTNKGIARLTPRAPTADDPSEYSIYTFTTEDGLPSNECNTGASMVDSKGRIWVGTVAGAAMLDPSKEVEDSSPKPLYVEQQLINGKEGVLSQNASLAYNENNLTFEYALLSLFRESDTRYRTQLVGLEESPSEWTADYKREFTNLSHGDYLFRAWGRDYAGTISDPIEIRFKIRPAPWQTWWAYLLYIVALTSIGYGGYRYRLQVLEERNQELEAKVIERTEQLGKKNEEIAKALEQIRSSQKETERKNQELIESHKRADRIFSALADTLPGTVLEGKYRLDEKIGAGGFGAVYRATHLVMKRSIAVKIFRPAQGNDSAEGLERFQQEAVSTCRVNHPNAVAVLDSGVSTEGIAYLVMELLSGHSLTSEMYGNRMLSVKRSAKILLPICSVLVKAHAAGIIHRDIKPDNIFLHQSPEGEIVKVVDFGIAKLMDTRSGQDIKDLTATGRIIGTPNYMSPERFEGKQYDGRSDVYSLGVMIYQMLSGQLPFSAEEGGFAAVMMKHLTQAPPPLRGINPDISEAIEAAVMRALEKDPDNRPTAQELAQEFATASGVEWSLLSSNSFESVIYEQVGADVETLIVNSKSQQTSFGHVNTDEQALTNTNETEKPQRHKEHKGLIGDSK
jgi:serine/threonine protein kinase/ligand-binding sensor domain-containing protein